MKFTEQQKEMIAKLLAQFHIGDGVDDCTGNDEVAMKRGIADLIEYLESIDLLSGLYKMAELAMRTHSNSDDPYYSCPLSENGCCNDDLPKDECHCGADEHNKKVDELLISLTTNV